jgi:hypothetical protein
LAFIELLELKCLLYPVLRSADYTRESIDNIMTVLFSAQESILGLEPEVRSHLTVLQGQMFFQELQNRVPFCGFHFQEIILSSLSNSTGSLPLMK